METLDLDFIWAGVIAFAVLAYVILDGFDLGVGILFPSTREEEDRNVMMNSVAPIWDGNETWLILGGGGLFAAFPLAYSIVLPALYAPLIAMLLGLVFRGVSFEARWRSRNSRWFWDASFFVGSLAATLAQGITLGALVQGIEIEGRAYAGGWWDWLTPFSILTGAALVVGYALLGATWLMYKTEGPVHDRSRRQARVLLPTLLAAITVVSLWTPFLEGQYYLRWFALPTAIFSVIVPALVAACAWVAWKGIEGDAHATPFLATLGLFVLCFAGIGISFYPNIVPPSLTIAEAAAPDSSQMFMLVGASVLIPVILIYTGYAYWVFRGKVRPGEGYH